LEKSEREREVEVGQNFGASYLVTAPEILPRLARDTMVLKSEYGENIRHIIKQ
jgi:hypothetical protein